MSENKDNKLTLINEKTANDYLTHTERLKHFLDPPDCDILSFSAGRINAGREFLTERKFKDHGF